MIKLEAKQLEIVNAILRAHVPDCEVRVFGSRASGNPKPFSDLDLVLLSPAPLSDKTISALQEAFSESALPIRVDLLDWATLSAEFQNIIQKQWQPLC